VRVWDGLQDGAVRGSGRDIGIGGLCSKSGGGVWQRRCRWGFHHVLHMAVDLHVVQRARQAPLQQLQLLPACNNSSDLLVSHEQPGQQQTAAGAEASVPHLVARQHCWADEATGLHAAILPYLVKLPAMPCMTEPNTWEQALARLHVEDTGWRLTAPSAPACVRPHTVCRSARRAESCNQQLL
jgi:hypothetical protein